MALSPGTRLGPYEIAAPLGAGGMGEVYRARDTRLDRTVALKVVRTELAVTDEGRRRFEREARAISQISHPNVCALFDVGREAGREFLVMELVEGDTLAARLARGALPIADVLRLGRQMARGLDAAHRRGIVHRDFKPGNVLLSKHGAKVLDFGLARALGDGGEGVETRTLSTTAAGTILGTLPYMAPEQIQGGRTDARTDVFALGAVLYEMLAGRRAFEAPSQAGIIAAVVEGQPPSPSSHRTGVPAPLERLVAQCLAKDPEARPQTAGEVARALELVDENGRPSVLPASPKRERWLWAALTAALLAALVLSQQRPAPVPSVVQPLITFDVPVPAGGQLPVVVDTATPLALSPDGRHLGFMLTLGEVRQLWLHSFETKSTRPLRGTEGVHGLFWSPSSTQVAFFAGGALKRISIDGDIVQQISESPTTFGAGIWAPDDTIVFREGPAGTLVRVRASGGTPETVISAEGNGGWPSFLPGGKHFLMGTSAGIFLGSLEERRLTRVLDAPSFATYASSGHLLYVRDASLVAQPFDAAHGRVSGDPRVLAEGLQYFAPTAGASFSAAESGAVAYLRSTIVPRRLVWIDRAGRELAAVAPDAPWIFAPRLSHDGTRLAVSQQIRTSGSIDLWMYDLPAGTPTRLTSDVHVDNWVTWWPDGQKLVFARSGPDHPPQLFTKNVTDVAPPERLASLPGFHYHPAVAPGGGAVVYCESGNLFVWRHGSPAPEPLVRTPFDEGNPAFSPDGRWLAYESNASGRLEVYVEPFGRAGERVRISSAGGRAPRWRGDGRELFFLDPEGRLSGASLEVGGTVVVRATERLAASVVPIQEFDVSGDGRRFVVILEYPDAAPPAIAVMLNWQRLLD